jgi:hypothetical protein
MINALIGEVTRLPENNSFWASQLANLGNENAPVTHFTFDRFLGKFRGEAFWACCFVHRLGSSLDFETSHKWTYGSFGRTGVPLTSAVHFRS